MTQPAPPQADRPALSPVAAGVLGRPRVSLRQLQLLAQRIARVCPVRPAEQRRVQRLGICARSGARRELLPAVRARPEQRESLEEVPALGRPVRSKLELQTSCAGGQYFSVGTERKRPVARGGRSDAAILSAADFCGDIGQDEEAVPAGELPEGAADPEKRRASPCSRASPASSRHPGASFRNRTPREPAPVLAVQGWRWPASTPRKQAGRAGLPGG